MIRLHFCVTNNVAEYEALINGLCIAAELGVQQLYIYNHSELTVNQVMGESNCDDSHMAAYHRRLGSGRRSSMVSSFIISFDKTMRQPTPSPGVTEPPQK
jgi:ribonuclease HI